MIKVFLGGTCANTTWREELIYLLRGCNIGYYNPVVPKWTPVDATVEDIQKDMHCGVHLYVLTKEMSGVYSISEAVQSSNNSDVITYVHIETEGFDKHQLASLNAIKDLLKANGAYVTLDGGMSSVVKILKNFK